MLLMVPAAYHDWVAVQVCDLVADRVRVSAKLLYFPRKFFKEILHYTFNRTFFAAC